MDKIYWPLFLFQYLQTPEPPFPHTMLVHDQWHDDPVSLAKILAIAESQHCLGGRGVAKCFVRDCLSVIGREVESFRHVTFATVH